MKKGAIQVVPILDDWYWYRDWYSRYYVVRKKAGGLNPQSLSVKQIPMNLQIQNVNTQIAAECYKPRILVHNDQSHRRPISHRDTLRPQACSEVGLRILGSAIRSVACSSHLHQMCPGSIGSALANGCSHISLSGGLGFSCER